jgi:hypothetical protein
MGDKDRGSAALAGAAGAVAAEVVAEAITDNAIKNIHAEAKAEGKVLTEAEFQERFSTTLEMTTDWGRLGAAVTALVTGLDANIATATAANAVNNNLIPMLIAVGYVAYVAYDVYDTYKEKGLEAAVLKLGFEVGTGIAGGVVLKNAYKLGKIVAPTAEAAWIAYMEAHPGVAMVMDKLMGKITPTITKVTEKVSAGVNKVADKMATGVKEVNDAARNLLSKGKDKVGKSGKPRNAGSDAVNLGSHDKVRLEWTTWDKYEKVLSSGKEYAKIGDRLYTKHAVERMQPSGLGMPANSLNSGRSFAPSYVEEVIRNGTQRQVVRNGTLRTIHSSGTAEVVTENGGKIIVTVNPFRGAK